MINRKLINPNSIAVIGGSDDTGKPGGTVLKNLISNKFAGNIYVVNPKAGDSVQGCRSFKSAEELPVVDLAILAIPAAFCPDSVDVLCNQKNCGAFIVLSAGFSEDSPEGAGFEKRMTDTANAAGATLIGPNCVGAITPSYAGVFTQPIPHLSPLGIDFISGSGATIVFILETGMQLGLRFASVFSVGNSAQTGVEDILEYLDNSYVPGKSAPVKMLYIENICNPAKLYRHASSLIRKGARICAIKAGYSEAGSRAASSHTGAMATPDKAVTALFRKAGIIRCYSRTELVTTAAIMMSGKPAGKRFCIITHAGGPAVMLTDCLATNGIQVPRFTGEAAEALKARLFKGSSVGNPIDFLSTGTREQLRDIVMTVDKDFDVDAMCVIFGKPGLGDIYGITEEISDLRKECRKPLYPILTSVVNARDEIEKYQAGGGISFPEEVQFGKAYAKIMNAPAPISDADLPPVDRDLIRSVVDGAGDGYLAPEQVGQLLDAAGIKRAKEFVATTEKDAVKAFNDIEGPVAMKVTGPLHKSDVGGVTLNVNDGNTVKYEFKRMMEIPGATGVLLQPMLTGTQIFVGAKREDKFGHLVMCGLGGIYVEVLHDVSTGLSPISQIEADEMIHHLRSYPLIQGIRGQEGVNEKIFIEVIRRVSALCAAAPEIFEMDINPLMGNAAQLVAVDTRIRIEKGQ